MNKLAEMQFTRGALLFENMDKYSAPILDFPFEEALDVILQMRQELNQTSQNGSHMLKLPAIKLLNDFLYFFVPTLAHPFINNYLEEGHELPHSGKTMYPMPAMGIPRLKAEDDQQPPLPDPLLKRIFLFWIETVIENKLYQGRAYFTDDELSEQRVVTAINKAKQLVNDADIRWRFETLRDVWEDRHAHEIGYRALQSLIAVTFIQNTRDNPVYVEDEVIKWRASQEGTHLIPVSQPFQHPKNDEYYAYTLEIELRDMPGRSDPLVYFIPRLRRYMSSKTKKGQDDARVMVEFPSPLSDVLPSSQVTVQVPLRVFVTKESNEWILQYRSSIISMLQRVLGSGENNIIVPAEKLFKQPEKYLEPHPDWGNAKYHIVYATGMKPNPKIAPGLPNNKIQLLHHAVSHNLEEWFKADEPQPVIDDLVLSDLLIYKNEILPLVSIKTIQSSNKGYKIWGEREPSGKRIEAGWLEHIQERFRIALNQKPLVVLLIADNDRAFQVMEFDVRSVLAVLSLEDQLPEGFEIQCIPTPSVISNDVTNLKVHDDVKAIRKWITESEIASDSSKSYIAILQRPNAPLSNDYDGKKRDDAKKQSLRSAFGTSDIATQMVRRFPDQPERGLHIRKAGKGQPPFIEERSRVMNAISDALIAGTGMLYGSPAEVYSNILGFDADFAQEIVVEYWVRWTVRQPKIDYIAVARQYAGTGYIEMILPDMDGNPLDPMSVHDASLYLQTLFAKSKDEKAHVYTSFANNPDYRVFHFFESQLYARENPTLIVPQVGDWRSRETKWFSDEVFEANSITIGSETFTTCDLGNVRVVKMLADEKYNLRYWLQKHEDKHNDAVLAIHDIESVNPTLYSVDTSMTSTDVDEDISADYKRGRVIEFASLMMQPADKGRELQWCAIPHLARVHPGWSKAKIVYPYPYHLMTRIIKDARWCII
ncbi:MAG: DUF3962 domain-containing protein [Chloroflexota bacterium]